MVLQFKLRLWLSILLSLLIFGISAENSAHASDARANILQASNKEKSGEYVRSRFLAQMKKPFIESDQRKKMLVIGDSHAQDFFNMMLENNINQRYQIRSRRVPAICGIYLGAENISSLIEKKHASICQKADTLTNAMPQIKQADVIIIAANWKLWSAKRLSVTIKNLDIKAPQQLFVVGRKSFGKINLRSYLRLSDEKLLKLRNRIYGVQQEITQVMRESIAEGMLVDIQSLICKSDSECPIFTPQVKLISFDGGHLTKDGAKYIGKILLQNSPLNSL